MVGFDAVREIAMTVGVIEEMLKGHQHERVEHICRERFMRLLRRAPLPTGVTKKLTKYLSQHCSRK